MQTENPNASDRRDDVRGPLPKEVWVLSFVSFFAVFSICLFLFFSLSVSAVSFPLSLYPLSLELL